MCLSHEVHLLPFPNLSTGRIFSLSSYQFQEQQAMSKEKEEKKEAITAVYKVNLHCPKCAQDIRTPLLRTPGVHNVDAKYEKNEVTVKGFIEKKKIQGRLEKLCKNVDIISETKCKVEVKEKMETIKTIKMKTYMHCGECERELRRRLLKHKGIHSVKTDTKGQTVTIEGVIGEDKLQTYMRKRVHKHAEIIKAEKKKEKVEIKVTEKAVAESQEVDKVVVVVPASKTKEERDNTIPYFVHYVYAPQVFSDENPNACSLM